MQRSFKSASDVVLYALQQQGPQTTHQLYKACQALDAKAEKTYIEPGHRDFRITGGVIRKGTVPPPHPDHLVRSVR